MLWKSTRSQGRGPYGPRRRTHPGAGGAVDPGERPVDGCGARRAAGPDPGSRAPAPRPPARAAVRSRRASPRRPVRGRGRPAKVFALTDSGHAHFDQQYDDLAVQALRFLAETGGEEAVRAFAERRVAFIEAGVRRRGRRQPRAHPGGGAGPGLHRRGLRSLGAQPARRHQQSVGEQLCQQHCPVAHVAHEFPQLCEAETEAISRVLGSHVQRLATIAHGDGVCTTCIPSGTRSRRLDHRPRRSHPPPRKEVLEMTTIDELQPRAEGHRPLRVRLGRQRRRRRRPPRAASTRRSCGTSRRRRTSRSGCWTCA